MALEGLLFAHNQSLIELMMGSNKGACILGTQREYISRTAPI